MLRTMLRTTAKLVALAAIALPSVTTLSAPVLAAVMGPAYFLGSVRTGEYGPCSETIGAYEGESRISATLYDSVYIGTQQTTSYKYVRFEDRGFNSAYRYRGCYGSYPAWGYYGAHEISRTATQVWLCYEDQCMNPIWYYSAWRSGW